MAQGRISERIWIIVGILLIITYCKTLIPIAEWTKSINGTMKVILVILVMIIFVFWPKQDYKLHKKRVCNG